MAVTELFKICCRNTSNRKLPHYGMSCGAPVPKGVLKGAQGLAVRLPSGRLAPVQTQVTERWFDGSIKWMVLDFDLPFQANQEQEAVVVRTGKPPAAKPIEVFDRADSITVTSASYRITIDKKRFSIFKSYQVGGKEMMAGGSDVIVEDLGGKRFYASLSKRVKVSVLERGVQRVVVEVSGRHRAEDDSEMLSFRLRYTVLAQDPCCMLSYKFTNREEPETGVKLAGIHLVLPTALGGRTVKHVRQSVHGDSWFPRPVEIRENVELIAAKPVNESVRAIHSVLTEGKIVLRNFASLGEDLSKYPYFLRPGNARTDIAGGLRQMYPFLGANGNGRSVVGWFCQMEYHYPKAVSMERNVLAFDIWPASHGELHVRRGQSVEHDLFVNFAGRERRFEDIETQYLDHEVLGFGLRAAGAPPVSFWLDASYVRSCEVLNLHRWLGYDEEKYLKVEIKLGSVDPAGAPQRGMFDYGDNVSPDRSWAHNNENDAILLNLQEYLRRGEPSMLASGLAKARHNAHVDFIAYDPNPLRQGTMPAHCPEHVDGATYPSHMWVDGLMAAYCLTGEPDFRAAAISVGENMLRWQKARTTFYCDSRECGWPMLAYLRLYEHTRQKRWLDAAGEVFEFYRDHMTVRGEILYDIPHGMGTFKQGYGEFITWRACFFYYELTGRKEVKDFLVKSLKVVYHRPAKTALAGGGWGANDMFPCWALYQLTGEKKYLQDNYPFLRALMGKTENFAWGGNDMHFFLGEVDRLGDLEQFV